MPDDELAFTVSAREIYDKVAETAQLVRELKDDRTTDNESNKEWRADVEGRLRSLERYRNMAYGAFVLLSGSVGYLIQWKVGS